MKIVAVMFFDQELTANQMRNVYYGKDIAATSALSLPPPVDLPDWLFNLDLAIELGLLVAQVERMGSQHVL